MYLMMQRVLRMTLPNFWIVNCLAFSYSKILSYDMSKEEVIDSESYWCKDTVKI